MGPGLLESPQNSLSGPPLLSLSHLLLLLQCSLQCQPVAQRGEYLDSVKAWTSSPGKGERSDCLDSERFTPSCRKNTFFVSIQFPMHWDAVECIDTLVVFFIDLHLIYNRYVYNASEMSSRPLIMHKFLLCNRGDRGQSWTMAYICQEVGLTSMDRDSAYWRVDTLPKCVDYEPQVNMDWEDSKTFRVSTGETGDKITNLVWMLGMVCPCSDNLRQWTTVARNRQVLLTPA
jgi:hypothetical protein